MKNDKYFPELINKYSYNPITGFVTVIDTGHIIVSTQNGYPVMQYYVDGRNVKLAIHRFAMWFHGYEIYNNQIDHINGIRSDNRLINLRIVNASSNRRNSAKPNTNKSGISGVCWHKHKASWEVKGLRKTIGYSRDFFEACCMRKSWENRVGGYTSRHGVVDSKY